MKLAWGDSQVWMLTAVRLFASSDMPTARNVTGYPGGDELNVARLNPPRTVPRHRRRLPRTTVRNRQRRLGLIRLGSNIRAPSVTMRFSSASFSLTIPSNPPSTWRNPGLASASGETSARGEPRGTLRTSSGLALEPSTPSKGNMIGKLELCEPGGRPMKWSPYLRSASSRNGRCSSPPSQPWAAPESRLHIVGVHEHPRNLRDRLAPDRRSDLVGYTACQRS